MFVCDQEKSSCESPHGKNKLSLLLSHNALIAYVCYHRCYSFLAACYRSQPHGRHKACLKVQFILIYVRFAYMVMVI